VWLVYFFVVVIFPIAFPISVLLDLALVGVVVVVVVVVVVKQSSILRNKQSSILRNKHCGNETARAMTQLVLSLLLWETTTNLASCDIGLKSKRQRRTLNNKQQQAP